MTETRPRGRPRGFDAEVALRHASDAFRDGGFSSTSLDDIVRATGLNRPSLYAAFGDKKALYLAALETLWADIDLEFQKLIARDLPLGESLKLMLNRSVSVYLSGPSGPRGCLAVCTASAEAVSDADIRAALRKVLALMDERIAVLFAKAGDNDPAGKARLVSGVLHSMSIRARAGVPREVLTEMAEDAVKLFAP